MTAAADDCFPDSVTLSDSQYDVLKTIMQGKSVFYTGAAGTGKSFILRILQEILHHMSDKEAIAFTSPTGVAACNIGGMTIHSWSGIGLGAEDAETLATKVCRNKVSKQRWNAAKILVIDEISMLSADLFDKLNIIGQRVRDCNELFGGIQLVLCGDFFQLPPVTGGGSKARYCFESNAWKWLFPTAGCSSSTAAAGEDAELEHNKMIVLSKIFRQKDSTFINILNEMRCGRMSAGSIEFLHKKCQADTGRELVIENNSQPDEPMSVDGEAPAVSTTKVTPTRLFSVNRDVDEVNSRQLKQLASDEVRFQARDAGDEWNLKTLKQGLKVPEVLDLRVGAQVMLLKNLDVVRGLANGTRGRVVGFVDPGDRSSIFPLLPKVEFYCSVGDKRTTEVMVLNEEQWTIQVGESVKASRSQIPLMLAWAISIHKAQGMTIPFLEISFQNIFEYGQAYVSISRATDLEGLILRNFDPARVKAHATVVAFYKEMGFSVPVAEEDTGSGDGAGGPAAKGTVNIESKKLVDMFLDVLEGHVPKAVSARKRKVADGWLDTKTVNKNIPPWMVQKEKARRRSEAERASLFFLPKDVIAANRRQKEAEEARAAEAKPQSKGKMDAFLSKSGSAAVPPPLPLALSTSSSTAASASAIDRFSQRFVSASGRGVVSKPSERRGENVFDKFKYTGDGNNSACSKEVIILSDDSNGADASKGQPRPQGGNVWDFFADSAPSASTGARVNKPAGELPFQESKSSFDYSTDEPRQAARPSPAPLTLRGIIAATEIALPFVGHAASTGARLPPGVVPVPSYGQSAPRAAPPGVVPVPVPTHTAPKPLVDAEASARIERNRLAAMQRLQETRRRRAQEDADAVLSNIMAPGAMSSTFQYH